MDNPFGANPGIYTEAEIWASQLAFLKEWSLHAGVSPKYILESRDVEAPASAAAAAQKKLMDHSWQVAANGLHCLSSWAVGHVLSLMELPIIDGFLLITHIFSIFLLLDRIVTIVIHLDGCCCRKAHGESLWGVLGFALCPAGALAVKARQGFCSRRAPEQGE